MVIKLVRPDRFLKSMQMMVLDEMGKFYLDPPQFNLESLFKESSNLTPLIFILQPCADPRNEI